MTISIATFLSCVGGLLAFSVGIFVMRYYKNIDQVFSLLNKMDNRLTKIEIQVKIISNGKRDDIDKMIRDNIKKYKEGK